MGTPVCTAFGEFVGSFDVILRDFIVCLTIVGIFIRYTVWVFGKKCRLHIFGTIVRVVPNIDLEITYTILMFVCCQAGFIGVNVYEPAAFVIADFGGYFGCFLGLKCTNEVFYSAWSSVVYEAFSILDYIVCFRWIKITIWRKTRFGFYSKGITVGPYTVK